MSFFQSLLSQEQHFQQHLQQQEQRQRQQQRLQNHPKQEEKPFLSPDLIQQVWYYIFYDKEKSAPKISSFWKNNRGSNFFYFLQYWESFQSFIPPEDLLAFDLCVLEESLKLQSLNEKAFFCFVYGLIIYKEKTRKL